MFGVSDATQVAAGRYTRRAVSRARIPLDRSQRSSVHRAWWATVTVRVDDHPAPKLDKTMVTIMLNSCDGLLFPGAGRAAWRDPLDPAQQPTPTQCVRPRDGRRHRRRAGVGK